MMVFSVPVPSIPAKRLGVLLFVLVLACDEDRNPVAPGDPDICGLYEPWESSEYVLPYSVGNSFVVIQGNCSFGSHQREARHAYDFGMPVGTVVVAARAGEVTAFVDRHPDAPGPDDNFLRLQHLDGSFATYTHIQQGSVELEVGEFAAAGQPIAKSGNSGGTGGIPHLHFQVAPCERRSICGTLPITFRNTDPNPNGLQEGVAYQARSG